MRRGEKETGLEMRKNHRALLQTIWAWALITILSIIYVPWNIETEIAPQHGLEQQLSSREAARPSMAREATVNRTTLELSPKDETNVIGNDDFNATYHQLPAKYHTVFSTGCSLYQDWQSYIFFYSALQSGQEGHITRIASGCEGKNKSELEFIFQNEIAPMDPERLHLHQTPEYGYIHKRKIPFKYFNKPYGLRHWFENVLGYPENHAEHDDSIIILMDPDQILLRPFTDDFTNSSEVWRLPEEGRHKLKVEHGSPFSQNYGYDIEWLWVANKRKVFRRRRTPISKMSDEELMDYYKGMGAPYIATAKDMYEIVKKWTKIVPRVRDEWPNILSEMFAYNWAIAHLKLRHTIAYSFMVSEVGKGGEGWSLVDTVDGKDVCHNYPKSKYPHVIHYCQDYAIGKWYFSKYFLPTTFISCESPLLKVPPGDLTTRYKRGINPNGFQIKGLKPLHRIESAFVVCTMIRVLNSAAVYYKDSHCDKRTANYSYSFTFFKDMYMEED